VRHRSRYCFGLSLTPIWLLLTMHHPVSKIPASQPLQHRQHQHLLSVRGTASAPNPSPESGLPSPPPEGFLPPRTSNLPYLKACHVLQTCLNGIRPFVGMVIERLREMVVESVRLDIERENFGECAREEWDCSTIECGPNFTEDVPVTLPIRSVDLNGVVDCGVPHHLKPHLLYPCSLKNAPGGMFSDDEMPPGVQLVIFANPSKIGDSRSSTFILSRELKYDSRQPYLQPFHFFVEYSEGSVFHDLVPVILCSSRPGFDFRADQPSSSRPGFDFRADQPSSSRPGFDFRADQPSSSFGESLSYAFWTVNRSKSFKNYKEFKTCKHGLKKGQILRFSESPNLPPHIMHGRRYMVIEASKFSFKVCGPIVCPVMQFADTDGDFPPIYVVRRSPIGRCY